MPKLCTSLSPKLTPSSKIKKIITSQMQPTVSPLLPTNKEPSLTSKPKMPSKPAPIESINSKKLHKDSPKTLPSPKEAPETQAKPTTNISNKSSSVSISTSKNYKTDSASFSNIMKAKRKKSSGTHFLIQHSRHRTSGHVQRTQTVFLEKGHSRKYPNLKLQQL
jgi:hypothetical protein